MARLFLAAVPPVEARSALVEGCQRLRRSGVKAQWQPTEKLHVTVCFFGEVAHQAVESLIDGLRTALAEVSAAEVAWGTLGAFRLGKPGGILWAGVEEFPERAVLTAGHRCAAAVAEALGLPYDRKPLRPHITLARHLQSGHVLQEYLGELLSDIVPQLQAVPSFYIDTLILMASQWQGDQLRYLPQARFTLAALSDHR
ncbi:MAG: RNA 2',3'-cyclic phosphodiesterase [Firmicutes bacterium]|nr:RNA 2',3'-cyclic phosphodiesterase [Bacillota bacterium]